jgi:molybdate transport system regulatory protein
MGRLNARFKLWLNTEEAEGVFGDGKWRLLSAIEKEGSLRAASDKLGISYRKAWGDLKKAEEALGVELVAKQRGGSCGGGSGLTEAGKKWVRSYAKFRSDIEKATKQAYDRHIKGLTGSGSIGC